MLNRWGPSVPLPHRTTSTLFPGSTHCCKLYVKLRWLVLSFVPSQYSVKRELSANSWSKIFSPSYFWQPQLFPPQVMQGILSNFSFSLLLFYWTGPTENFLHRETGKSLVKIKTNKNTLHGLCTWSIIYDLICPGIKVLNVLKINTLLISTTQKKIFVYKFYVHLCSTFFIYHHSVNCYYSLPKTRCMEAIMCLSMSAICSKILSKSPKLAKGS